MTANASPARRAARPTPPSRRLAALAALAVVALIVWAAVTLEIDLEKILRLPEGLGLIFYRMFLEEGVEWDFLPGAIEGMLQSLQIAWIGTIIGGRQAGSRSARSPEACPKAPSSLGTR
jgi:ABC-type phosphate/phosphonate transport system permease subunit